MTIGPGLINGLPDLLVVLLLLLLIHVLHSIALEIVHGLPALKLLLLVLELLEVANLLLLIALDNNVRTISTNQDFSGHS